jgi:hypothetical protein
MARRHLSIPALVALGAIGLLISVVLIVSLANLHALFEASRKSDVEDLARFDAEWAQRMASMKDGGSSAPRAQPSLEK